MTSDAKRQAATTTDAGLLLIRAMLGVVFIFHGSQKLFAWFGGHGLEGTAGFMEQIGMPMPWFSALMAGSTEFFGGLALVLGLGTRLVSVPLTFTMLVAAFVVHRDAFSIQQGGMEYALTLAVVLVGLILTGGGRFHVLACWKAVTSSRNGAERVASSTGTS